MTTSRALLMFTSLAALTFASGCGMQDAMLGASGGLLFQGFDTLARPGEAVPLVASLQGGDYLRGMEGYLVGFYLVDHKIGECRTDDDGLAQIMFTPAEPGNHVVIARLEDPDVRKYAIEGVEIVVAARKSDARMAVVDLDRTLVKSGFGDVLAGRADPMPDSKDVMARLARDRAVVYLTHRPDIFTESTKAWLRKFDYPLGPVLTSTFGQFLQGSGAYKSARIEDLRKTFPNIDVGIGDKPSDAAAYAANGLTSVLVLHPDLMTTSEDVRRWVRDLKALPDTVNAVESWQQVGQVLFEQARFPVSAAVEKLTDLARRREAEALAQPAPAAEGGAQ